MNSDLPRISLRLRYAPNAGTLELAQLADDLGFHGVWVSEPWGFDAGAVLGAIAARTRRVILGTHIVSVYARTPAATAGLAGALATLSDGRFRLGLGTSGRQVVEGWHGQSFTRPLARVRDTIITVRAALAGEPVPTSTGRPLRFSQLDAALSVPIYLAALGPRHQRLAAELADGWTPTPYAPGAHDLLAADLATGLREHDRVGRVQLAPVCPVAIGDNLAPLFDLERGWSALYLGGMGSAAENHYARFAERMGHGEMVDRIQYAWPRDRRGAKAAVADDYIDSIGLFGPPDRVRERLDRYRTAGVDELILELRKPDLTDQLDDLRHIAKALAA